MTLRVAVASFFQYFRNNAFSSMFLSPGLEQPLFYPGNKIYRGRREVGSFFWVAVYGVNIWVANRDSNSVASFNRSSVENPTGLHSLCLMKRPTANCV